MTRILSIVPLLLLTLTTHSQAQPSLQLYLDGGLLSALPLTELSDVPESGVHGGVGLGIDFQPQLTDSSPSIAVILSGRYHRFPSREWAQVGVQPDLGRVYQEVTQNVSMLALQSDVKITIPLGGILAPYVMGGLGYHRTMIGETEAHTFFLDMGQSLRERVPELDLAPMNSFGLSLGIGTRVIRSDSVGFFGGFRYSLLDNHLGGHRLTYLSLHLGMSLKLGAVSL